MAVTGKFPGRFKLLLASRPRETRVAVRQGHLISLIDATSSPDNDVFANEACMGIGTTVVVEASRLDPKTSRSQERMRFAVGRVNRDELLIFAPRIDRVGKAIESHNILHNVPFTQVRLRQLTATLI